MRSPCQKKLAGTKRLPVVSAMVIVHCPLTQFVFLSKIPKRHKLLFCCCCGFSFVHWFCFWDRCLLLWSRMVFTSLCTNAAGLGLSVFHLSFPSTGIAAVPYHARLWAHSFCPQRVLVLEKSNTLALDGNAAPSALPQHMSLDLSLKPVHTAEPIVTSLSLLGQQRPSAPLCLQG